MANENSHSGASIAVCENPAGASLLETNVRFDRADCVSFAVTTSLALVVYLFTLAPQVTLGFSGIFSTGAMYAGVPHPPGYPLWTIYSWCFVKLVPFSNVAWRVALGSAVAAALACGLIALMVSHVGAALFADRPALANLGPKAQGALRVVCGYAAGMSFGFNGAFWGTAVETDNWPLSILLFVSTLCLLMRWMYTPERRRYLYVAGFVYGLTLTNSQALLVAAPAFPLFVVCADKKLGRDFIAFATLLFGAAVWANAFNWFRNRYIYSELPDAFGFAPLLIIGCALVAVIVLVLKTKGLFTEWPTVIACALLFVAGLSLYLFVPITSMTNPPVNWGYARTVEGFFHTLSRGQYEKLHPTMDYGEFVKQLWMYLEVTAKEFGWIYLPFAVLPFSFFHRLPARERRWLLGSLALFFCLAPLMIALLNPGLTGESRELNKVFFSASYVVLAVWVGLGCLLVGAAITRLSKTTP